jgi:hypothetical protein
VPPSGPAKNTLIDSTNLLVVASVHGRPQGDILHAIHSQLRLYGGVGNLVRDFSTMLHSLLTRQEVLTEFVNSTPQVSLTINTDMAQDLVLDTDLTLQ